MRPVSTIILLRLLATLAWAVEPIQLVRPEATFHSGAYDDFARVVDGVETGPQGWSTAPKVSEPQALVVRCADPVEAAELDIALYFLAGRPFNTIAEFALSYTMDAEPSLKGNWMPLPVQRFGAEVATLRRTDDGHLRTEWRNYAMTGTVPDDTYRVGVLLPGGRATGFRLDVFPVQVGSEGERGLSWHPYGQNDFSLTEFRVAPHFRETTNIALHCPVTASHTLYTGGTEGLVPEALTDGLPATIAHPMEEGLGSAFHFEIDLGRVVKFDHIGLRNRGDFSFDRLSRLQVQLYENVPADDASPVWAGIDRADGSHPEPGAVDIVRAELGKGTFRGRYLRLSSDSPVPLSPQLAEVEVYETRTPELVSVLADGREIPVTDRLVVPPGVRRLSLRLRIPQEGLPPGVAYRWRVRGDLDDWQTTRTMTVEMACPSPGKRVFEAQALHSDGQWDASVCRLPVEVRQFFWQSGRFHLLAGSGGAVAAGALGILSARRRAAGKIARSKAERALAEERTRIARDLHDDLGVSLTQIGLQCELIQDDLDHPAEMRQHVAELSQSAKAVTRAVDEIVWAVTPGNDTLEKFTAFIGPFVENCVRPAGLSCRLALPTNLPDLPMSATVRHHLCMVVREALNNVLRHAQASTVGFSLAVTDRQLSLTVTDDGRGFEFPGPHPATPGRLYGGNGLSNMRKRMDEIHGTLEIATEPGAGVSMTFRVKL